MRYAVSATIALILAASGSAGIVANGDIEEGGRSSAAGWATDVRDGLYEFSVEGGGRDGSRCLAIRCTGETGWSRWYTADVFLVEGNRYRFRAWVRTQDEGAAGECWVTGGGGQLVFRAFADVPEWTPVEEEFVALGTGRVGLYLQSRGTGSVYFDDVSIDLVSTTPPADASPVPTTGAPISGIVIPASGEVHLGYLAVELQRILKAITGRAPAIVVGRPEGLPGGRPICVGLAPEGADYSADLAQLDDEGIVLDVRGDAIVCLGKTPRAVYYAVHEFLYVLGCRWIMPEGPGECLPRVDRLDLPTRKIVHNPSFALRGSKTVQVYHYPPEMASSHVPTEPWIDWAARNRMNALKASYPQTWDYGAIRGYQWSEWSGHTLYTILPPEQYFADHPEYYTLVKGVRTHQHSSGRASEICVSNPDLPRLFADFIIEYFDSNPHAKRFGICAEDEPSYWCECDGCKALDTRPVDWSTNGEGVMPLTDRWLWFINQVADLVGERYPDRYIHTFAYGSTREPPRKQRPRPNVMIELTWWDRCFKHRMLDPDCEVNRRGMRLFNRWRELAPLSIYGYLDYHYMEAPCPYFHAEADFLRTVHARGVRHISDEWDTTFTASPLLLNLRARLLWDVETDVDAFIDDFCRIAYGPAAQDVRAYFDTLERCVTEAESEHVGLNDLAKFTPEALDRAHRHLRAAQRAAQGDEVVEARLARLEFSLLFVELSQLQTRLEQEPELYARTEPLKVQMDALVRQYEIPVILGAYNALTMAYRPPVEALQAEVLAELPEEWLFRPDPGNVGEQQGWHTRAPDASWKPISTHRAWEEQGYEGVDGYGWYTVETVIPAAPGKRVWLLFGAVDETCTVWLNGEQIGESQGDPGVLWDKPVAFEITGRYRPGEANRITVRVHDSQLAGGIWKPVELRAG